MTRAINKQKHIPWAQRFRPSKLESTDPTEQGQRGSAGMWPTGAFPCWMADGRALGCASPCSHSLQWIIHQKSHCPALPTFPWVSTQLLSPSPPAPLPPCADAFPQSYLSYSMQKTPSLGPSQPPWPKSAPTASRKGLSEPGEKCSLALVSSGTVKAPLEPCLAEHLGPASPSSYRRVWRVERQHRTRWTPQPTLSCGNEFLEFFSSPLHKQQIFHAAPKPWG